MKHLILILSILFFVKNSYSQEKIDYTTYFESKSGLETPNYKQTMDYCELLAKNSQYISISSIGTSPQGRRIPILIIDKNGFSSPTLIKASGRAIVFIQACVHAGEPDGKDAGLMLVRDIAITGKYKQWLETVSIVFMPIFNVDGHERFSPYNRINQNGPKEMGWRTTSKNYNLNRDYLKADASEMKDWIKMFHRWNFDFLFDCHTTDGADYQYAITYSLETNGTLDDYLTNWIEKKYLPYVDSNTVKSGYKIFPYVIFRNWHDPRSGLLNYASSLKLLNGYAAANNRICLLIETHQLKDYKTRVLATYEMLKHSLEMISKHSSELINLNKLADEKAKNRSTLEPEFPLNFVSNGDSQMVVFKGVHYDELVSKYTGKTWFLYDSTMAEDFLIPYYKKLIPKKIIKLPYAYIVPPEWTEIIDLVKLHNLKYFTIGENISINVAKTQFSDIKLSSTSYEGRQMVQSFSTIEKLESTIILKNSLIIPLQQFHFKLIAHMFEPNSGDSFFQWGFFNSVMEQKEYAESYVMEKMMIEMLTNNPNLQAEFDTKMKNDSTFANDSRMIYNWFYSKTPYWDTKMNVYPILKITDKSQFDLLKSFKNSNFSF